MSAFFERQLVDYVEYHRDPRNCTMHVFGILTLFTAAVLPLSQWSVHAFGAQATVAAILAAPVLIYWLLLDTAVGLGILGAAALLLAATAIAVNYASPAALWSISAVMIVIGVTFQIVGHRLFEHRKPSLLDHPVHLLMGPMFVMAKLYIALGFRDDLASIIDPVPELRSASTTPEEGQGKSLPHS